MVIKKAVTISTKKKVTKDEIRKKTQEIYCERIKNGTPGDANSDWV